MVKKVILIVFSLVAVLGLVLVITGAAMGGELGGVRHKDGRWVYQTPNQTVVLHEDDGDWEAGKDEVITQEVEAAEHFEGMESFKVVVTAGEITLTQGEQAYVEMDGNAEYIWSQSGKELTMETLRPDEMDYDDWHVAGLDWLLQLGEEDSPIRITVPKTIRSLEVELEWGTVFVEDMDLESGDFSVSMGTVNIEDCEIPNTSVSVDAGTATISDFKGDVCTLETSAGEIQFDGELSQKLEIDCSVGTVTADLTVEDGYSWSADVGLGTVMIDGDTVEKSSTGQEGDGAFEMDLECEVGTVTVEFSD